MTFKVPFNPNHSAILRISDNANGAAHVQSASHQCQGDISVPSGHRSHWEGACCSGERGLVVASPQRPACRGHPLVMPLRVSTSPQPRLRVPLSAQVLVSWFCHRLCRCQAVTPGRAAQHCAEGRVVLTRGTTRHHRSSAWT